MLSTPVKRIAFCARLTLIQQRTGDDGARVALAAMLRRCPYAADLDGLARL
jgi:hypothetical protein